MERVWGRVEVRTELWGKSYANDTTWRT